MSLPSGKSALQRLSSFVPTSWYTTAIKNLMQKIIDAHAERSEIISGGLLSVGGTISSSALQIDMTAMSVMLKGYIMAAIGAQNDVDLFTTASAVGQAIFADGSSAAAILLSGTQTAYVTVIVCNSDGAGGADETDNGTPLLVAVVAGTSSTYAAQTGYLTSTQIQAALEASTGVHAGVTAWAHVGRVPWANAGGSPTGTPVPNRNNVLGA